MRHAWLTFQLALAVLLGFFAVLLLIGTPARSQEPPQLPCAPAAFVEDKLAKEYGETLTAAGSVHDAFIIITTNPKTGTFTILLRRPDGLSCFLTSGKGWALADAAKAKGDGM